MSEWKEYKLDEIIERFIDYRGKTPRKVISGIPLITAKVVKNGRLMPSNEFIAEEDYHSWMTRGFPEINDIVLTTEAPLGEVALIKDKNVALAQRIITLRGKERVVDNIFLKYYLQSPRGQNELQSRASGTTVMGIKAELLKKIPVFIPPIEEQKRIAGVLSSLDDKIDLLNRENATLEALAETLFRHYFIENPDPTWKEGKIADLVDFNPNRKLTKNEDSPYIEMANIETQGYAPSSWRMRPFASGTKFINGDAIMARISPCLENGKAAYIDFLEDGQVGWGSTEFLVMRSKMGLHPFFAYIMTRYDDFRDHAVSSLVGSSGRQRVDLDNLLKYSIFIPDEKAITRFNQEMEMIVSKMRNNQLQMRTLAFQRDIILPRLMYGELKVTAQ